MRCLAVSSQRHLLTHSDINSKSFLSSSKPSAVSMSLHLATVFVTEASYKHY